MARLCLATSTWSSKTSLFLLITQESGFTEGKLGVKNWTLVTYTYLMGKGGVVARFLAFSYCPSLKTKNQGTVISLTSLLFQFSKTAAKIH